MQHANNVRRWAVAYNEKMEQRRLQKEVEEQQQQQQQAEQADEQQLLKPNAAAEEGQTNGAEAREEERRRHRRHNGRNSANFHIPDRDVLYRLEVSFFFTFQSSSSAVSEQLKVKCGYTLHSTGNFRAIQEQLSWTKVLETELALWYSAAKSLINKLLTE